jgi:hypothetical protein
MKEAKLQDSFAYAPCASGPRRRLFRNVRVDVGFHAAKKIAAAHGGDRRRPALVSSPAGPGTRLGADLDEMP